MLLYQVTPFSSYKTPLLYIHPRQLVKASLDK